MFVWGCFQRGGGGDLCAILNGRLLNTPITCFAARRPFVVATAPIMSPRRGRRCGFRPRCPRCYLWNRYLHEPKYVCADFCIRASVCPAIGRVHVCVGVCAEWKPWWDAWHKQGRAVGGWCQGLTPTTRLDTLSDSWESAGNSPTGKVSASIGPLPGCSYLPTPSVCPPLTRTLRSRWSPERHCRPFRR